MAKRNGSVHVATIKRVHGDRVYTTYLLRRSYRDGAKVKHETLGNLSHLPLPIIEMVRGALRGESYVLASDAFEILRSLPHGHVAAVLGTLRKIGLDDIISSRSGPERELVLAMIVARVIRPRSKLATVRGFRDATKFYSLADLLSIDGARADDLYDAMDWVLRNQWRIETKLAKRHLKDGVLVLYDVSGSYYTGTHCRLAKYGHIRDGRKDYPQITYGLLCNREGCPIAIEIFEGNISDSKTLKAQIRKIRRRFRLDHVILVGDRGMLTQAQIRKLRDVEGLDWITALRAPAIRKLAEQGAIQMSLFDETDLAEIHSPDYPGERLVVCRNPLLAAERARNREELLKATEKKLEAIAAATRRRSRPLRGKAAIGLRVGKEINRRKVGKHFKLTITDTRFSYERDRAKIDAEAALDGIYVIRTSVDDEIMESEETVGAYKGLSVVERAFRSLKAIDLKVRPIYHRRDNRVRAHVFICMLAYYVEWHMRQALAPILFDDHEKEIAGTLRESVVEPAKRSPSAEAKAQTKRTENGEPVHSFQTLLDDLGTITKNRVCCRGARGEDTHGKEDAEFDLLTTPTPLQRRAFELLGLPISLT